MRTKRTFFAFAFGTGFLLLAMIALIGGYFAKDREQKLLFTEYRVYQAASSLLEAYLQNGASFIPADKSVLGFGVYRGDGSAVSVYGTAPSFLEERPGRENTVHPSRNGKTMRIVRGMATARMMMREGESPSQPLPEAIPSASLETGPRGPGELLPGKMEGPQGRMGRGMGLGSWGMSPSDEDETQARYIFIDYDISSLSSEGRLFALAAIFVVFALVALYLVLLNLYKRNESLLRREAETRELVSLGEAAKTLAHEIKNPLGVIRVQCATLEKILPEERLKNVDMIREETDRLVDLTDRIGEFLRSGEGEPRAISIPDFLEKLARRYEGLVRVEGSPSGSINFDPRRLESVFENLIRNARESMEGMEPGQAVLISVDASKAGLSISVKDSGCGIRETDVPRIFEPFFTTKSKGSGVGLAISRKFMESAGGSIRYRPRQGGGSEFILWFPWLKGENP